MTDVPGGKMRRTRNRQGEGRRLRAELIEAADRILARTGDVSGLSLRSVAREVGIATPSIYLHFADKPGLVHAVLSARFSELGATVQAAVRQASGPVEQLRAGCLAYCQFAMQHPNAYRVLFGRLPSSPHPPGPLRPPVGEGGVSRPARDRGTPPERALAPLPDRAGAYQRTAGDSDQARAGRLPADEPGARAFGYLVDGVSRCMHAGLAPAGDPHRVALNVWTALHGIVSLRASAPGFPWPPLEQQVDDVLAGLVRLRHNPTSARE